MLSTIVHVRENNSATVICPACNAIKEVAAGKFRHSKHSFKLRCHCQHVFIVHFNFRRHYRKQTSLPGIYEILDADGVGGGIIHISNLSRSGLGFTISGLHNIKVGQLLSIEFQLNDKNKTPLKKQAVVRSVRQNYIGCEFRNNSDLEKALGFFLQS